MREVARNSCVDAEHLIKPQQTISHVTPAHHRTSTEETAVLLYAQNTSNANCTATNQIVFVKTHKTGSTTLASIFERYGYYHDLTFALPQSRHFFQPVQDLFSRSHMAQISSKYIAAFKSNSWDGYNYLTNHARYNRPEMDAVVHNAIYVTILRSPVEQFESAFGYYELAKYIGLQNTKNPIELFMQKPKHYFDKKFMAYYWSRNAQLYDLGFDHKYDEDPYTIQYQIKKLDFEFDLVILTEYFDESLLLLRKQLCWDWDDILYFPKGIRSSSHRFNISSALRDKIMVWNDADVQLYDHFNRTLWRKIREYGPNFENDLTFFRAKLQHLTEKCVAVNKTSKVDRREEKPMLKPSASDFCKRVFRDDVTYTDMIRAKMISNGLLVKPLTKKEVKVVKTPVKTPVQSRPHR